MRRIELLMAAAVAGLSVSLVWLVAAQSGSVPLAKTVEAGLIDSGPAPAVYFNLRNNGRYYAQYTYVVTYNSSAPQTANDTALVTVAPGQTFSFTLPLERPVQGSIVVRLEIFTGAHPASGELLYNESWFVRSGTK